MTVPSRPPAPRMLITQAMIREFAELRRRKERLDREYDERRLGLIALIDGGASREPGPLGIEVRSAEGRPLHFDKVLRAFGPEVLELLKEGVEPTTYRRIIVTGVVYGDDDPPS